MTKIPGFMLQEWQQEPLTQKIERSKIKIKQFYEELCGDVYVAFSGGKDSTVLLDLVRSMYPNIEAVHITTPRYPETVEYIKKLENITKIIPDMGFQEIIVKFGYPVVSKEVSKNISRYRNTSDPYQKRYRLHGIKKDGTTGKVGVIPQKWHYLVNAPFKVSDKCCYIMKKKPFNRYEKQLGNRPFIGILAEESNRRTRNYLDTGCNIFKKGKEKSYPLAFWTEKDIWKYIKINELDYSKIYDKGETSTGCLFCMFGCHLEENPNRFQRMYHQHPNLYHYCMNTLGLKEVLSYLRVAYLPESKLEDYNENLLQK